MKEYLIKQAREASMRKDIPQDVADLIAELGDSYRDSRKGYELLVRTIGDLHHTQSRMLSEN